MIAGLLFPLLLLATDSPQLGAIAGPFYIFIGAVVGVIVSAMLLPIFTMTQGLQ
jgi:uncharacterized membrane protein YgaE (UPF0421/DUF939 family)